MSAEIVQENWTTAKSQNFFAKPVNSHRDFIPDCL
jgi:hypothetical protein